jgi:RHS repeat-associated protein
MRVGNTLSYLLSYHLGSTSLTTDASGSVVSEFRYKAWGETRYTSGSMPTKYTYTGQYSNVSDFGLMFYNARWYDPYRNHFTQPDTIVPDPYNPQSLYDNSLKHGLRQRLQSIEVVKIEPLQHDPLQSGRFEFLQLLPDLAGITHDCSPGA